MPQKLLSGVRVTTGAGGPIQQRTYCKRWVLSYNHSIGRTHSWRFTNFEKKSVKAYPLRFIRSTRRSCCAEYYTWRFQNWVFDIPMLNLVEGRHSVPNSRMSSFTFYIVALDCWDCPLYGFVWLFDWYFQFFGIVQTNDSGHCLLAGTIQTNDLGKLSTVWKWPEDCFNGLFEVIAIPWTIDFGVTYINSNG